MDDISESLRNRICTLADFDRCTPGQVIQALWSGYGRIQKVTLTRHAFDGQPELQQSCVIKFVDAHAARPNHPRQWDGSASHLRKVRSYEVERNFYAQFASRCGQECRVPNFIAADDHSPGDASPEGGWLLILEDLDGSGFPVRVQNLTDAQMTACLHWLAEFHGQFMSVGATEADVLWPIGTYWHLATRQEELAAMDSGRLKDAAKEIDDRLNKSHFQTLVHGDAKVANFCFPRGDGPVAAVDFQYVGRGCGMKDVAYFLSSCLNEDQCHRQQEKWLSVYFERLRESVGQQHPCVDAAELENQWRDLYRFAWADFYRFLAGWSPGHWKMHAYSDHLTRVVLDELS